MENQRKVDEVIAWYKEKWSLIENYDKKLKQIKADPKLKNNQDAINDLLGIDKTNQALYHYKYELDEPIYNENGELVPDAAKEMARFQTLSLALYNVTGKVTHDFKHDKSALALRFD